MDIIVITIIIKDIIITINNIISIIINNISNNIIIKMGIELWTVEDLLIIVASIVIIAMHCHHYRHCLHYHHCQREAISESVQSHFFLLLHLFRFWKQNER